MGYPMACAHVSWSVSSAPFWGIVPAVNTTRARVFASGLVEFARASFTMTASRISDAVVAFSAGQVATYVIRRFPDTVDAVGVLARAWCESVR